MGDSSRRLLAVAVSLLFGVAMTATSVAAAVSLTGVRSWPTPASTRIVFELSAPIAHVAPDSGLSREVEIALPGEAVARADSVPSRLWVHDGVVDSVLVATGVEGARFHLWFHDSTQFKVLSAPAQDGDPYRLVVEVTRKGAAAAEAKRLETIATEKKVERVRIVTVDPGHGGEDAGAHGPRGVLEKNVTLAVARVLVAELNQTAGVKAFLTRDRDYFIPLRERYHIAEKMKADLFISIHANSSKRRGSGRGSEVYFLSMKGASDQADADLADTENAADLVGGVSQSSDDLVSILYDLKRNSALQQSQLLAESLLDHLASDRRLESRGVKQAGFVVLKSVEFPSVLVETAFINNPVEARLLASREFQLNMGRQLAVGVRKYFELAGIELAPDVTGARVGH